MFNVNVITWAPHNHTDLKELYFYYVINCVNFEYMSLDRTEQLIGLFAPEMNDVGKWQLKSPRHSQFLNLATKQISTLIVLTFKEIAA